MSEKQLPEGIKYMVMRLDELLPVCTEAELGILNGIIDRILRNREEQGLPATRSFIVVESDKEYAQMVRDIITHFEGDEDGDKESKERKETGDNPSEGA